MDEWEVQGDLQEHILGCFQNMVSIVAPFNFNPGPRDVSPVVEEDMLRPIDALINIYNIGWHGLHFIREDSTPHYVWDDQTVGPMARVYSHAREDKEPITT